MTPDEIAGAERWRAPSPRLLTLRRLEVAAVALAAAVVVVVIAVLVGRSWVLWALLGVVALGVVTERTLGRRFRAWGYLERRDDLLVRRGIHFSHPLFQHLACKSLIKVWVNQNLERVSNLFVFTVASISAILR